MYAEVGQLIAVCSGPGAVPERIAKYAPFMESLAVTQHAMSSLYGVENVHWSFAAREVLVCVTKSSDELDEMSSIYVRACLGITGSVESFSQRMDDLTNHPNYRFPSARNTQTKLRRQLLQVVTGILLKLKTFPCAPEHDYKKRIRVATDFVTSVLFPSFESFDEDMQKEIIEEFRRALSNFNSFEARIRDNQTKLKFCESLMSRVVAMFYKPLLAKMPLHSADKLLSAEEIRSILALPHPLRNPEDDRSANTTSLLAKIILEIEDANLWSDLGTAGVSSATFEHLSLKQQLRLESQIYRLNDQP